MKKITALLLIFCFIFAFASCGGDPVETTGTDETEKYFEIEETVLKRCVGQADENGVYTVPDNITMIGEGAFIGDTKIKEIIIGNNVTTIGSGAFMGCTGLQKIVIPDSVTSLGSHAFYGCTGLQDITLSSNIDIINAQTFYFCTSIESIEIPDSIIRIDHEAFYGCTSLVSISLSENLKYLDYWTFYGCESLEETEIENCTDLKTVGAGVFAFCSSLKSITLPEGLESIEYLLFYNCSKLSSITVPSTITDVGYGAFNYTPWYTENTDPYLIVGDGVLVKCNVNPAYLDLSGKGIKSIGGSVFWNAEIDSESSEYGYKYSNSLTRVIIPEGIKVISTNAFRGCTAIESISLPSTLEAIGASAFLGASAAEVSFENCTNLLTIGSQAFYGCSSIKELDIPDSVKYIGSDAFLETQAYIDYIAKAIGGEEQDRYWIVGDGILLRALVFDGQTSINIPEGIKVIGGSACIGWNNALVITDPTTIQSVTDCSNWYITNTVTEITIPDTVTTICENAFFRAAKVVTLVVPDSVESIYDEAFSNFNSLVNVTLGSGLKYLGNNVFRYCLSLKTISLPASLEHIGNELFYGCTMLKEVAIPENVTSIGSDLFSTDCTSLTKVSLSSGFRPSIYDIMGSVTQTHLIKINYYGEEN